MNVPLSNCHRTRRGLTSEVLLSSQLLFKEVVTMEHGLAEKEIDKLLQDVKIYENECCRVCLVVTGCELVPMGSLDLAASYRSVTGLPFADEDGLPQTLCTECVGLLDICLKFRTDSERGYRCLVAMQNKKKLCSVQETLTKSEDADFSDNETNDINSSDYKPKQNKGKDIDEIKSEVTNYSDNEIIENDQNPKTNDTDSSNHETIPVSIEIKFENKDFSDNEVMENDQNPKTNDTDSSDHLKIQNKHNNFNEIKTEDITNRTDGTKPEKSLTNDGNTSNIHKITLKSLTLEGKPFVANIKENRNNTGKITINKGVRVQQKCVHNEKNESVWDFFMVSDLSSDEQRELWRTRSRKKEYLNSSFKCELCFLGFLSEKKFKEHMIYHSEESGPNACSICSRRFSRMDILNRHRVGVHERNYACKQCDFTSTCKNMAEEHMAWHNSVVRKCQYCDMTFYKGRSHSNHKRMSHPSDYHVCGICGLSFLGYRGLQVHRTRVHRSEDYQFTDQSPSCAECNIVFVSMEALETHRSVALRHGPTNESTAVPEKRKNSTIESTAVPEKRKNSSTDTAVPEIRKNSTNESASVPEKRKNSTNESTAVPKKRKKLLPNDKKRIRKRKKKPIEVNVECEECKTVLPSLKAHLQHYKSSHPQLSRPVPGTKSLCEVCGASFKSQAKFKEHKLLHVHGAIFQCDICKKLLKTKAMLVYHIRAHTNKFLCHLCGKVFPYLSNKERHVANAHKEVKDIQCNMCDKLFKSRASWKEHVRFLHNKNKRIYKPRGKDGPKRRYTRRDRTNDRPVCDICNKQFQNFNNRDRHLRDFHKEVNDVQCTICEKYFKSDACLKIHTKHVHDKIPWPNRNRRRATQNGTQPKRRKTETVEELDEYDT